MQETQAVTEDNGKTYWRSLDELAQTDEFKSLVKQEFPHHANELLRGPNRRQFLKVMAASLGLAGLTGCRWPKEKIVPYANRPEDRIPGIPEHFATVMELSGSASGLLVTSFDGRPVKIEGNPSHPGSQGATSSIAQATILELYDPDRSKFPLQRLEGKSTSRSWNDTNEFIRNHFAQKKDRKGKGVFILSEASSSHSLQDMRNRLKNVFPALKWHEYESISTDNEREGTRIATGQTLRAHPQFDRAKIVLSLDSDFLNTHPEAIKHAREFTQGRKPVPGEMNRLYVVESAYSITGAMADHRLPIPAGKIQSFLQNLALELIDSHHLDVPAVGPEMRRFLADSSYDFDRNWIEAVAEDLVENSGQSLIVAGYRQSPAVHALTVLLNEILGNTENTVQYTEAIDPNRLTHIESIQSLIQAIQNDEVDTLVILGGNPVFDAPADLEFDQMLKQVSHSIHLSLYDNETSHQCQWHIPRAHFLEAWGDARAFDGTLSPAQPLIHPLYNGKSSIEFIADIFGDNTHRGYDIVRRALLDFSNPYEFEIAWQQWLNDGVIPNTQFSSQSIQIQYQTILENLKNEKANRKIPTLDNLEIVFTPDSKIFDGRFANNGWLQETPDFLTKLTWDNAALIGVSTAQKLDIHQGDEVRVQYRNNRLVLPVYIMPGQADYSITVALGYGRTQAGQVGNGVGTRANLLRTSDAIHYGAGVTLEKTGKQQKLACTQDHFAIDPVGRQEKLRRIPELIHEASIEEFSQDPDHFHHDEHHAPVELWRAHDYPENRWGLSIDLNRCIGCNACVTACQSENNIPVVGKEQVSKSREMHWLKIDRYFCGDENNPRISHQPVACMHCEDAPCEQVCPVAATVHTSEGLNAMVYNRCVGTRYCSNNCPYKVRRFNFFNYQKDLQETRKMAFNPDVTVRSRGVMEKCTFCVQRIERIKIKSKNERRPIEDGEIAPACGQVCPAKAITFGDLNNDKSQVAQNHADHRAYTMLHELNVKPRTAYLAKITNPNPKLTDTGIKNEQHHTDA